MKNYAISLVIVSVVGGIINSLTSHFNNTKKYISYFVSLIAVISLLSPLINVIKDTNALKNKIQDYFDNSKIEEITNNSNNIIITASKEAIIQGIKNELTNEFNLDDKDIVIEIETNEDNLQSIKITKITVILTGKASWTNVDSVKKHLNNIIGGNIIVTRR